MKKNLFIIALLGLLCFGCEMAPEEHLVGGPFPIVNIDGCQYFSGVYILCHKGNCTNNIHIYNHQDKNSIKSLEEIIDNPLIRYLIATDSMKPIN